LCAEENLIDEMMKFFDEHPGEFFTLKEITMNIGLTVNRSGAYRTLNRVLNYDDYNAELIYHEEQRKFICHYGRK